MAIYDKAQKLTDSNQKKCFTWKIEFGNLFV